MALVKIAEIINCTSFCAETDFIIDISLAVIFKDTFTRY
jgi:hypothetical protein